MLYENPALRTCMLAHLPMEALILMFVMSFGQNFTNYSLQI